MFSSLIDLPNKQAVKLPQQIEKRVIANASAKSGNRAHGGIGFLDKFNQRTPLMLLGNNLVEWKVPIKLLLSLSQITRDSGSPSTHCRSKISRRSPKQSPCVPIAPFDFQFDPAAFPMRLGGIPGCQRGHDNRPRK
jgi:hypothetical protein